MRFIFSALLVLTTFSATLLAVIRSETGSIEFDTNADSTTEMSMNAIGVAIGDNLSASANLHVEGNVIVTESLALGGTTAQSNLQIQGTMGTPLQVITSNTTITGNSFFLGDTTSDNITITLPAAANVMGRIVQIKKKNTSNNLIISASEMIDDIHTSVYMSGSTNTIPNVKLLSNGNQWYILGGFESVALYDADPPVGLGSFMTQSLTATSVTLTWTPVTDLSFSHYEIWYGTSLADVQNRTGTATEWDDSDDPALATASTSTTTITGLSLVNTLYFKIWAIDNSANLATATNTGIAGGSITVTWDGSESTAWLNGENWDVGLVPGPHSAVDIPATGVSNEPTIAAGNYELQEFTIASGRTLTCAGNTTNINAASGGNSSIPHGTGVELTISGNVTVAGNISADEQGFASNQGPSAGGNGSNAYGAGYGGRGYFSNSTSSILNSEPYGSATQPTALGSGGGYDTNQSASGGAGGGAIKLVVSDNLVLSGNITANGGDQVSNQAGGGSGGSIWIVAGNISGAGNLLSKGGSGGTSGGGSGAGGRIRVTHNGTNSYTGVINLSGAIGTNHGRHGTYSFTDNVDLTVSNDMALASGNYLIPNLVLTNNATLDIQGDKDGSPVNGWGVEIIGYNATINAGASINANFYGFNMSDGPGKGTDGSTAYGAGHGGRGGGVDQFAGIVYGSATAPTSLGSGGGQDTNNSLGSGGYGGGAIILTMSDNVAVNGTITANGRNGFTNQAGGGSGGSIWINAGNVSGSGNLFATGGTGVSTGGSGGGGRLKIAYAGSSTYTGTIDVSGAVGLTPARHGTYSFPDNLDLTVSGNFALASGNYNIPNLIVNTGVTLDVQGDVTEDPTYGWGVNIISSNITVAIDGAIKADGYGFRYTQGPGAGGNNSDAGGGGYGGRGAGHRYGLKGNVYGSATDPTALGSGGGQDTNNNLGHGGYGGGAIILSASENIVLNGTVSADGHAHSRDQGGGGSGGSVYIIGGNVSGAGNLFSRGGLGDNQYGDGGGGRIKVAHTGVNTFTGTIDLSPGTAGIGSDYRARNGTYSFPDNTDLTVSNNMALASGNYNIPNLIITNQATLEVQGDNDHIPVNGWGVNVIVTNLQIDADATIDGYEYGFLPNNGPGAGGNGTDGGGGGYGGTGGTDIGAGGSTYGSATEPDALGSGGGFDTNQNYIGGMGGGAFLVSASDNVIINGEITVNGGPGGSGAGGGSGGSVWISAGNLSGSGNVRADGGTAGGGGGGGGRLSFTFTGNTSTLTLTATGAGTGGQGSNGTFNP